MARRRAFVFGWALTGTLLLAFLAAMGISRSRWGYCLSPPDLDRRIAAARRVTSLTPVSTEQKADGTLAFVLDPDYLIVKSGDTSPGGYYELELRVIYALQRRGKLPEPLEPLHSRQEKDYDLVFDGFKWKLPEAVAQMEPEQVAPLYALVESTGLLHPGTRGYDSACALSGIILEAEGRDGEQLLMIAVAGGQVSNDHYPYYEFLFSVPEGKGKPRLLSCKRWFYDNAGVEFLTWPFLLAVFSVPAVFLAVLITLLVGASQSAAPHK